MSIVYCCISYISVESKWRTIEIVIAFLNIKTQTGALSIHFKKKPRSTWKEHNSIDSALRIEVTKLTHAAEVTSYLSSHISLEIP